MTLIELLVALTISGVLVAGVYRTFVSQQHTFTVQDQVVDMQQNVRLGINRMTRELRMAGFGITDGTVLGGGGVNGFGNTVTPGAGGTSVTVVAAYQLKTTVSLNDDLTSPAAGQKDINVKDASGFDTGTKKYISINGLESHLIEQIVGNKIRFPSNKLIYDHKEGEAVYLVQAITYSIGPFEGKSCLLRDDNLGLNPPQPVAENIDSIKFRNPDGSIPLNPNSACMQVAVTATTDRNDPDYKVDGGFRTRTLTSNIQLRNR